MLRDWSGLVSADASVRGNRSGCVSAVQAEQKMRPHLEGREGTCQPLYWPRSWARACTPGPGKRRDDALAAVVLAGGEHAEADGAAVAVADVGVGVSLPEGLGQGRVRLLEHEADGRKVLGRRRGGRRRRCRRRGRQGGLDDVGREARRRGRRRRVVERVGRRGRADGRRGREGGGGGAVTAGCCGRRRVRVLVGRRKRAGRRTRRGCDRREQGR